MDKDWTLAYTTDKLYQAEMVKALLMDNEMEVVIINKQDSFYLIGDIEIYVKADQIIKAKHLIIDL